MVASEVKDIKSDTIVLPSNARDIMVEVTKGGRTNWKLQHSFDGSTWFDKTSASTSDGLVDIDGSVLQYVKIVFTGGSGSTETAKIYFGRSK